MHRQQDTALVPGLQALSWTVSRLQSFPAIHCYNSVDVTRLGLSSLVSALAEKLGISTQSKVNNWSQPIKHLFYQKHLI